MTDWAARLSTLEPRCAPDRALALFDELPAVRAEEIRGRWRGRELATGHPMDGLLARSGWYGKQFDCSEKAHPLLFTTPGGTIFAVDPRRVPLGLAVRLPAAAVELGRRMLRLVGPAVRTRAPRARLRNLEHRGTLTAAMIYDHLPIIDYFRRVDEDALLGLMDLRDVPEPYFFILARA